MPGLVPGIHALNSDARKTVDGRDKPGHDNVSYGMIRFARKSPMMLLIMS